MADVPQIVVFHDDHEECDKRLTAAQATIQTLKIVIEQAEKRVEDRDQRIGELAADLVEERGSHAMTMSNFEGYVEQAQERAADLSHQLVQMKNDRDARQENVEALRSEAETWKAKCHKAWDDGDEAALKCLGHVRERDLAKQNAEAVAVYAEERQRERDEARDEVARLNATIVRLACHRVGLHNCGGEWKNHDRAGDEPFPPMGSGLNSGGED